MSFAGYFHVRFLLSAFPPAVSLIWFGSVYLMTTAGFVAGAVLFCFVFCCCFYSVFILRYRRVQYGCCACFIFGQLTPHSRCFSLCLYTLVSLPGLYSAAYMTAFRSLLRRMFFLAYAYYQGVWLSFVCSVFFAFVCVSCFILFSFLSLLFPFLATISFAGHFFACFPILLSLLFFTDRVPGLIWFGYVYLVTTAGFVADQLM